MSDRERYKAQLRRQLGFLWRSCRSFDDGNQEEAIRIAVSVRVLVHDTRASTSLLSHLNAKTTKLLNTCKEPESLDKVHVWEGGLTHFVDGWVASLDNSKHRVELPTDVWWNQVVAVIPEIKFTRRMLVLDAANKEGGAHVDEKVPVRLGKLIDGAWTIHGVNELGSPTSQPMPNQHFQYLRQIGYEVLHSPELLALVGAQFDLPDDKAIKQQEAAEVDSRLDRISSLHETGIKLAQSGDAEEARKLFDNLIRELEPGENEASLEQFARVLLSKAKTYSDAERAEAIAIYDQLLGALDGRTISKRVLLEIFVKTQFAKAAAHTLLNQKDPAMEYFRYVYENTRQTYGMGTKYLEPFKFGLASLNNIMVFHLNSGNYEKVVETSDEFLQTFSAIPDEASGSWSFEGMVSQLGETDGRIISSHLSKCLRNRCLALIVLERRDEARSVFREFERIFGSAAEAVIQQRLSELQQALGGP